MRADTIPLCDRHYAVMKSELAPLGYEFAIDYWSCTNQWCARCYSEELGYLTPTKGGPAQEVSQLPKCKLHGAPMFISGLDRRTDTVRYVCPEPECQQVSTKVESSLRMK